MESVEILKSCMEFLQNFARFEYSNIGARHRSVVHRPLHHAKSSHSNHAIAPFWAVLRDGVASLAAFDSILTNQDLR